MSRKFAPFAIVALLFVAGCGGPDEAPESDVGNVETEIEAANARFETFIAGQQWDSLTAIYTEDAVVMPQGAPLARGADAIRDGFAALGRMGITSFDLETLEVERAGDMASEMGRYTLRGIDGSEVDQGKYLVFWKEVGDTWRMHRGMFNSDSPQQPAVMAPDRRQIMPGDTAGMSQGEPMMTVPMDTAAGGNGL